MQENIGIILKLFLTHLNESAISSNDCFNMKSEMLTCLNLMSYIYFRHCASCGRLQRFYSVMGVLTSLSIMPHLHQSKQWHDGEKAQTLVQIKQLSFVFSFRHELASQHNIELVSKVLIHNSSPRVSEKLEILSNGVN